MYFIHDLYAQLCALPRTVKLFYISDIFFAFAQSIFTTLFNLHLLKIGYDPGHIGTLQSLSALLIALTAVPIGLLADRFGHRWLYVAGSLLFGLPYAIMPHLTDFRLLLLAYGINSIGMSLMFVTENPLLSREVETAQRASVFSFMMINFFLWNTLGIQLAGFLTRWMPTGKLSEYVWPLALAAVCAVIAGLLRLLLPFKPHAAERRHLRLLPSRTALGLAGVSLLAGAFTALTANFGNVIFAERFQFHPEAIATILTVGGLLGWLGSMLVPRTSGRMGDMRGYMLVVFLQGLTLLYLALAASPVAFLPGFWLRNLLGSMQMPLFAAFAMGVSSESERATVNSYAMVGNNLGSALAARWYGLSLAGGQYLLSFGAAGLCALATAAVTLFAFRRHATRVDPQI